MLASELVKMGNIGGCCFSAIKEIDMKNENWDDKTDEIATTIVECVDRKNRDFCTLEENRTKERFRVTYFVGGHQVGVSMNAFDREGAMALVRLMLDDRGDSYRGAS